MHFEFKRFRIKLMPRLQILNELQRHKINIALRVSNLADRFSYEFSKLFTLNINYF